MSPAGGALNSIVMHLSASELPIDVLRNLASHADWPQSFCGRLAEDAVWDAGEFSKLQTALAAVAGLAGETPTIDRKVGMAVLLLYQRVSAAVGAHRNPADVYKISGIDGEALYCLMEAFDTATMAVFSGVETPPRSSDLESA